MSDPVAIAQALLARPSITPDDAGCQAWLAARLASYGFVAESLRFGSVDNLWARLGSASPVLCFLGHTDVVPPGPLERWTTPPFEPSIRDGQLYGRGACDMKGAVAAMVAALERFAAERPRFSGSLALLLTSDEEGDAIDGTAKVIETLKRRGEKIDYCLVGEPSSMQRLGDTIRNGRRGSLSCVARVPGRQGHVAYPDRTINPIHRAAPILSELATTTWDEGTPSFPPTSFQVVRIQAGAGADNVVPGEAEFEFNFRFSPASPEADLRRRVAELFKAQQLEDAELTWRLQAVPFVTEAGKLLTAVQAAVSEVTGSLPQASTGGGTSDGRFVAPTGAEIVELGPLNRSAHAIDEHTDVSDLENLTQMYVGIMRRLLPAA